MQLTKGFEQAVCIITLLATQDPQRPISSQVIHHRLGGSQTYLRKIIRKLVVAGLVKSISGNNGGFSLARGPESITIYDIVTATEGQINSYPDSGLIDTVFQDFRPVAHQGAQVINQVFHAADERWADYLKTQTVFELIAQTLGQEDIPTVDWNDSDEHRELLIQKLVHNLKDDLN
ncbi:hypothetical protein IV38_GL001696 [Lactobacillus selangorensis]|uniref:Rrf2 family transcriptional regulator n=1 Tax=Lactobacillus selangorensis TaxID=81857 RepID=A0A0R2FHX9_9LACO|nr:Rrf2 family transcriptional regulator [Lactobacillus selangorensis]KRN28242.1 hypothetical protein IV38_GL001696 [Lactobacillus selangorensis]KRN30882.1 hypothetical protein IV40_GL001519 [Lactobacillus selangorensis]